MIDDRCTEEEAVRFTSELIRIDTTNRGGGDGCERLAAEYIAARLADVGLDPMVLESASGRTNVVARFESGQNDKDAVLLHGHLDVVPADASAWAHSPLSGEVRDGVVYGRGAVDMKSADAVVLAVVRELKRLGRRPAQDIILAFTADEEDTGQYGAGWLVQHHADLFDGCKVGIGESGGFTVHARPGFHVYPIACAERGVRWIRVTAHGKSGHGAKPNDSNAITLLSQAVARVGSFRWPVRLCPTVRATLSSLERAITEGELKPDSPREDEWVEKLLPALGEAGMLAEGSIRNSCNPTAILGGEKVNVIPDVARGLLDGRVVPGGEQEFEQTIAELLGSQVEWEYVNSEEATESDFGSAIVTSMAKALQAEDPGAHILPYCLAGGTDAKHFARLGIAGYGFTPLYLPASYRYYDMFHGVDERVPISAIGFGVRVLRRLLLNPMDHGTGLSRQGNAALPGALPRCPRGLMARADLRCGCSWP